jgi:hypothetical protein
MARKSNAPVLSLRALNRALLARQMLLERAALPIPAVVERLVGLQSQAQAAPFIGLWTRITGFTHAALTERIDARSLVKTTLMRATLHLITTDDLVRLRGAIQPVLESASDSIRTKREVSLDIPHILDLARAYINEAPRSFAEISAHFEALIPDTDIGSIRYTIRTHLPLVQVPTESYWRYPGNPKFTLAESWIQRSIPMENDFRGLALRYLAAFGPAGVTDLQTWSGLEKLKDAVEKLKPELMVYQDENGRELYDLPDTTLPDPETPAPIRFLPEYDNVLLSHSNRTRIIAEEHRKQVYLPGLRVASTILIDGFVAGVWKSDTKKGVATLTITPFAAISPQTRTALEAEGESLLRLAEPDAKKYAVVFDEA